MANIEIMNFDSLADESYGKIRADLEKAGTPIGPLDMMITGHAKAIGLKRFVGKVEDVKDLKNSDNKPYYSLTNVAPNGLTLYSPTKDVAIYKYREDTMNTNSFLGFKYKTTTTVYKFDYIFY
ncbi:MAG: hypothetical protein MJ131_11895 [Lachnospiraceae bacterium]|nr:hypothetical protein [Lachnospiraceae bacterium]